MGKLKINTDIEGLNMRLDTIQARRILIEELGYRPDQADSFLSDFPEIHGELSPSVIRWMHDRTILDATVLGASILDVMRVRKAHFLMAIREINRLLDTDLPLEQRRRLADILKKPAVRW